VGGSSVPGPARLPRPPEARAEAQRCREPGCGALDAVGAGLGEGVDAEGPGAAVATAPARGQPTVKSSSKGSNI
jgi:hypothetical protein